MVLVDDSLYACGEDAFGQLGLDKKNRKRKSVRTLSFVMNGVEDIAAGGYHSMVLKSNGDLVFFF